MIEITGVAYLKVPYKVQLDMTREKFDEYPVDKQDDFLREAINLKTACKKARIESFDIVTFTEK